MKTKHIFKKSALSLVITLITFVSLVQDVSAATTLSFSISPMKQSIILNPGDVYYGSFKVSNPSSSNADLQYEIEQKSFYVDESYGTTFDGENSPIVAWTTLNSDSTGILAPNSNTEIRFTISVPIDAAAGGQYEAFLVKTKEFDALNDITNAAVIKEELIMAHLVFAEIAGNTVRRGEVIETSISSFLLTGDIVASSAIKNTGNIHGNAIYKLQIFPLFSNEEIYTNEEDPESRIILPDRTLYNETIWENTPPVGIFNVIYTVEFEGVTAQVSKMVIKCPIWLLFIIIFAIIAIIIYFVTKSRTRKKSSRHAETE